jgi:hypothetical protein
MLFSSIYFLFHLWLSDHLGENPISICQTHTFMVCFLDDTLCMQNNKYKFQTFNLDFCNILGNRISKTILLTVIMS